MAFVLKLLHDSLQTVDCWLPRGKHRGLAMRLVEVGCLELLQGLQDVHFGALVTHQEIVALQTNKQTKRYKSETEGGPDRSCRINIQRI